MEGELLFFAQTDTTVGLLCSSSDRLSLAKERPSSKKFITEVASFKKLKSLVRIHKRHRKTLRNSNKCTFVQTTANFSFRVPKHPSMHVDFIAKYGAIYSTSANKSGEKFSFDFANSICDVIVIDKRGFEEKSPSRVLKLGKRKLKKIRG